MLYLAGTAASKIPILNMLSMDLDQIRKKAHRLAGMLMGNSSDVTVVEESSMTGGGAMPGEDFASAAIEIKTKLSAQGLFEHFKNGPTPIVGRISQGRFLLDVRTIQEEDFPLIAARLWEVARQ